MWINHVIKTAQWRSAPQIRPAPHFVVSHSLNSCPIAQTLIYAVHCLSTLTASGVG